MRETPQAPDSGQQQGSRELGADEILAGLHAYMDVALQGQQTSELDVGEILAGLNGVLDEEIGQQNIDAAVALVEKLEGIALSLRRDISIARGKAEFSEEWGRR